MKSGTFLYAYAERRLNNLYLNHTVHVINIYYFKLHWGESITRRMNIVVHIKYRLYTYRTFIATHISIHLRYIHIYRIYWEWMRTCWERVAPKRSRWYSYQLNRQRHLCNVGKLMQLRVQITIVFRKYICQSASEEGMYNNLLKYGFGGYLILFFLRDFSITTTSGARMPSNGFSCHTSPNRPISVDCVVVVQ